jgi:hypothetical protein
MAAQKLRRVHVLVETRERTFKGYLHMPAVEGVRLSDHLNSLGDRYLRMSNVKVSPLGDMLRVTGEHEFVAVAAPNITYITPLDGS